MGADLLSILDAKPFRQLAALDALEASPDIAARLSVGQEQVEEIEAAIERESAEAESHRADLESRLAAKREEIEQRVAELRASGVAALEAEVEEILGELNQLPAVHR